MYKKLFKFFLVVSLILGVFSSYSFAEEDPCVKDPRECFDFDEEDKVIPDNKKVERTFDVPPIKTGFVIDFYNFDILPSLTVELLTFNVPSFSLFDHKFFSLGEDFSINAGVSVSRAFFSLHWEIIPAIKLGPTFWAGYNVREKDPAVGIGLTILDF